MKREMYIQTEEERIAKKYNKKYFKVLLKMTALATLKAVAIVATFFFIASKIRPICIPGGPAELVRFSGFVVAMLAALATFSPIFRIRAKLISRYNKEIRWLQIRKITA